MTWSELLAKPRDNLDALTRSDYADRAKELLGKCLEGLGVPRRGGDLPSRFVILARTTAMSVSEYSEVIVAIQFLNRVREDLHNKRREYTDNDVRTTVERLADICGKDWAMLRTSRVELDAACLRELSTDVEWQGLLNAARNAAGHLERRPPLSVAYQDLKQTVSLLAGKDVGPHVLSELRRYAENSGMTAGEFSFYERGLDVRRGIGKTSSREITEAEAVDTITAFYVFIKKHGKARAASIPSEPHARRPLAEVSVGPSPLAETAPSPLQDKTRPSQDAQFWRTVVDQLGAPAPSSVETKRASSERIFLFERAADARIACPWCNVELLGIGLRFGATDTLDIECEACVKLLRVYYRPGELHVRKQEALPSKPLSPSVRAVASADRVGAANRATVARSPANFMCPWCFRGMQFAHATGIVACTHCGSMIGTDLRRDGELTIFKFETTPDTVSSPPRRIEPPPRVEPSQRLGHRASSVPSTRREPSQSSLSDSELTKAAVALTLLVAAFSVVFALRPAVDSFVMLLGLWLAAPLCFRWPRRDVVRFRSGGVHTVLITLWLGATAIAVGNASSARDDLFRVSSLSQVFTFQEYPFKAWGSFAFTVVPALLLGLAAHVVPSEASKRQLGGGFVVMFVVAIAAVVGLQDCVGCIPAD